MPRQSLTKLLVLSFLLSVFVPALASASNVNWTTVKDCPDGYRLVRGQGWGTGSDSRIFYSAGFFGSALASLEGQLGVKLDNNYVSVSTLSWGKFVGYVNLNNGPSNSSSLELQINELSRDRVSVEFFQNGKSVANYQFFNCS